MRVRFAVLLSLLIFATLDPTGAGAGAVSVDVSAGGARLGRLTGPVEGGVAYFPLEDLRRLVGGVVHWAKSGDQATLVVRRKTLDVRRDTPRVRVDGRSLSLSAPVRVRRGVWLVPGDLLVRALPVVLGTGVQVVPATGPGTVPVRPPTPAPTARPAVPDETRARPNRVAASGNPVAEAGLAPPGPVPSPAAVPAPGPAVSSAPAGAPGPIALLPGGPRASGRGDALELRYRSYPTYTRVVLEGETPLEPRLVDSRGALLVSLVGATHRGPGTVRTVRDGFVSTLELGDAHGTAALRIAFEREPASRKVYRLDDPPRLVLDFYRPAPPVGAGVPPMVAVADTVKTIVIDPGHGGHDPGAIGPSGLQEKELTLDVARRVAGLVQEDLGVKAVLTRSQDRFVALRERTTLANRERADLFVSIHVNSAPAMAASGAETYFLSSEATDNAARAAAAAENKVIALEANARGGSKGLLRSILWDLAQSDFQQESSRLAESLQTSLDRALRLPSRGVKQAPFYVLGGAAMPAVLTEIGFITNPQEEQRLRDDGYRDRIARAIVAGIAAYKQNYDRRTGAVARR